MPTKTEADALAKVIGAVTEQVALSMRHLDAIGVYVDTEQDKKFLEELTERVANEYGTLVHLHQHTASTLASLTLIHERLQAGDVDISGALNDKPSDEDMQALQNDQGVKDAAGRLRGQLRMLQMMTGGQVGFS